MSTASVQPPVIPPRPSRSQDREENTNTSSLPKIPPRPIKRFDRSISPNPDRFAPSPLNESPFSRSPKATRSSPSNGFLSSQDPIHNRPGSVSMPSVGEEGNEYDVVGEGLAKSYPKAPASPEHTRFAAEDLKLHAPKPTFPAQSAKQRVMAVTRTDSDRAASYGIGKPSSEEATRPNSLRRKASSSGMSQKSESAFGDEEHGIPEIGQRVPMNPNLGDVQAPSPAPGSGVTEGLRSGTPRHHSRKHSSRGFNELPPGSYGLHGHTSAPPTDKFERAWYEKHPDFLKKDCKPSLHDRQNDYAMSSTDLNKIVKETHSRGSGMGTSAAYVGTPSEEVGYQASEEYTSRMSSPELQRIKSPLSPLRDSHPELSVSSPDNAATPGSNEGTIHVDESHNRRRSFVSHDPSHETKYNAPILAEDELEKGAHPYDLQPAVEPPPERSGSAFEIERAPSRPTSRPTSMYNNQSQTELTSTPLEDVEEYEPLFDEDGTEVKKSDSVANTWKPRHKFPSKDVWEDAPDSVNYTAEVSTPEPTETERPSSRRRSELPTENPALEFARKQEELAEQEARGIHIKEKKPVPVALQHVKDEARPQMANRFPSRDVWEDTPESLMHEAVVDTPEPTEESPVEKPYVPARPQKKGSDSSASTESPSIPERPRPKHTQSSDDKSKPTVSEKPKPQVPVRPAKAFPSGTDLKDQDSAPKQKPAVPARPAGGKIAALQAGFLSDLNKRLQIGPQAPKKDEPPAAEAVEEKEKAPLSDARKGRARGPQRRAPAAKTLVPAAEPKAGPTLSFSPLRTCWSIGDSGVLEVEEASKLELTKEPVPQAEGTSEEVEEVKEVGLDTESVEPETTAETVPGEPVAKELSEDKPEEAKVEVPASVDAEVEAPKEKAKTLAANTAGEPVIETTLADKKEDVEPVEVKQTGGEAA
ncbi:Putative altered inheritance of mitochondria protein [Colletotrichum destructivum]|uniref:Altered inheritance of mitochondria protein n=1 Tax=Colletotrichum destructivum TaxID=34406 RepID=A0AAX4ISV1_9PEZI|nr:Putative altered inheritance of mitochondria protein [Colletotrichum destructivum]